MAEGETPFEKMKTPLDEWCGHLGQPSIQAPWQALTGTFN